MSVLCMNLCLDLSARWITFWIYDCREKEAFFHFLPQECHFPSEAHLKPDCFSSLFNIDSQFASLFVLTTYQNTYDIIVHKKHIETHNK